jgi:hypothetical protein
MQPLLTLYLTTTFVFVYAAALWEVCHQHAMANRKSVEAAGVTGERALPTNLLGLHGISPCLFGWKR